MYGIQQLNHPECMGALKSTFEGHVCRALVGTIGLGPMLEEQCFCLEYVLLRRKIVLHNETRPLSVYEGCVRILTTPS